MPIPGTKRRTWLRQNVGALEISLDASEIEQLDRALAHVAGPRYNTERMSTVDR